MGANIVPAGRNYIFSHSAKSVEKIHSIISYSAKSVEKIHRIIYFGKSVEKIYSIINYYTFDQQ